jgi:SAM-dependent methyltransferase
MTAAKSYVLGHTERELERLATQARLIDPITRRFLISAGIDKGMRVLDIGSGAGDVAMLLADLVGADGEVVGTDLAQTAIEAAERRIKNRGLGNVTFLHGDPASMKFDVPFDAVVGRYVLQFIPDPSATLARLAGHLWPGGIVAFHELDWGGARSSPPVPTYDRVCDWVTRAIEGGGAQVRLGTKLGAAFRKAGLREPYLRLESVIGSGPGALDAIHLVTDLFPTLLPTMERLGIVTESEVGLPGLVERILDEVGTDGTLVGRAEVGAWTTT